MVRRAMAMGPLVALTLLVAACVGGGSDLGGSDGGGAGREPWPVWGQPDPGPPGGPDQSAESGRFRMTITYGMEGQYHLEAQAWGAFDRRSGASELGVHLDPLVEHLDEWGMADLPHDLPSQVVVRTVDGAVFVSVETGGEPMWAPLPIDPAHVPRELGMVHPDDLLVMVHEVAHEVEVAEGPVLDGVPTWHHRGWLGADSFATISSQQGAGSLGELMEGAPPGLFDRLMRFEAWIGDDGVVRRLVVELDHEGVLDLAEVVDGYRDPTAPRVTIRHEIEWTDVNRPVDLAAPGPDDLVVPPGR